MSDKTVYVVGWFSPRRFANEGVNYYGTLDQWRKLHKPYEALWSIVSRHRTLSAAQKRAEKEVRDSRKRTSLGEQDRTSCDILPD